jgi:hypothetical protein
LTQSEKLQQIVSEEDGGGKKLSPINKCHQAEFAALSKAVYAEECFDWEILGDQEHHIDTNFTPATSSNIINSSFDFGAHLDQHFFEYIFPSAEGHAAIIDKYLADPRVSYYESIKSHKISFFDYSD